MNELKNRTLYFGDNLDILRKKIPPESIDLVYLDPPFNSKKNYNVIFKNKGENSPSQIQAFEDTWNWNTVGVEESFTELVNNEENIKISNLMIGFEKVIGRNGTLAYLSMMTTRLIKLRDVLKSTGSIYLHCDSTASHYLKVIMDVIFGEDNFRNEIVWHYTNKQQCQGKQFLRSTDSILFYTKSDKYIFNPLTNEIHEGRGWEVRQTGYNSRTISGKKYIDVYDWDKYDIAINRNVLDKTTQTRDLSNNKNIKYSDNCWDISIINPMSAERLGYPTQKPEALLECIIKASSNEGDTVLDPFCGCGTTVAVSEKLNRKWIGIDITPIAIDIIKKRMSDHYPTIKIELDGLPKDLDGAKMLAEQCGHNGRFDFQYWSLSLINAIPNNKGPDKGIDGIIRYSDIDTHLKTIYKDIIISVKSGQNPKSSEIRDLKGIIEREKASGGIYITLYEPTKDMLKEAAFAGTFKYQNINIPKIQICTVEDLLNGKLPIIPQSQDVGLCKPAEKKPSKSIKIKQSSILNITEL